MTRIECVYFNQWARCEFEPITEDDCEVYFHSTESVIKYFEECDTLDTEERRFVLENRDKILSAIQVEVCCYYFVKMS